MLVHKTVWQCLSQIAEYGLHLYPVFIIAHSKYKGGMHFAIPARDTAMRLGYSVSRFGR